uniref:Retrovirus-related Pol polyprotein from transposon TNT 1-94-like beta-barrel domain-containing protein n=1 Tax=Chenopodium quinoa TaxID=63459 RepID=A0A803MJF0_CHEQI
MALGSRNKLGYIDGKLKKPNPGHADYGKWYRNDNAVRVKERYGQTNALLLYQLKKELSDLKQENQAVGNFYCKLKNLWDHISSIEGILECTCGAMTKCTCNMMKKLADAESLNKLIQFLMALNKGFENIRGSILAMEPLPPVNRAFHLVQQQEKQKEITGNMQSTSEMSAMNVKKQPVNTWQKIESKEAKMKKKCDYCDWFKNPPKGKGNQKTTTSAGKENAEHAGETPLDKNFEQGESSGTKPDANLISTLVQEVMKAMSDKQHMANFAGNLLASNVGHYFQVFDLGSWIVDSGASDHMVGNRNLFHTIKLLDYPIKVGLPDGQVKNVKEIGTVRLTARIMLKNVLLLPDFKHNLMSDPISKEVIARGRTKEGLFRLSFGKNEVKNSSSSSASSSNNVKGNVYQNMQKQVLIPHIVSKVEEVRMGENSIHQESVESLDVLQTDESTDESTTPYHVEQISDGVLNSTESIEDSTGSTQIQNTEDEPQGAGVRRSEREITLSTKLKDYVYKLPGVQIQSKFLAIHTVKEMQKHSPENEHGTLLNQRKYILDILKNVGMEDCKIAKFLFPKGMRLSTETGEILAHPEIYRRIVGKLLYLNITRPDISYSVQQLSQFMHCPRKPHLQVALHVIRYLKGTMDWGLYYPRNSELKIEGYSDADWGSCAFSARSLTNYCIFIGQCLVSWKTKKQKTVSKSSTESEYRSMSHTTSELVWVDDIFAKS